MNPLSLVAGRAERLTSGRWDSASQALRDLEVPVEPGKPDALENGAEWHKRPENWYLQELEVGSLCRAAPAVEGSPVLVRCWCWEGTPLGKSFPDLGAKVKGTIVIPPAD
jgi:hypothetical protein